jgi:hypothetical protein
MGIGANVVLGMIGDMRISVSIDDKPISYFIGAL